MENKVIWLTGLSGSGKTTLANNLKKKLLKRKKKVLIFDVIRCYVEIQAKQVIFEVSGS